MTVADRIKEKRLELNLSQTELAKRAGYTDKTSISKLEHSKDDISIKQISRVADALGTTIANLMGWADPVSDAINGSIKTFTKNSKSIDNTKDNEDIEFSYYVKLLWDLPSENRQAIYKQIRFEIEEAKATEKKIKRKEA